MFIITLAAFFSFKIPNPIIFNRYIYLISSKKFVSTVNNGAIILGKIELTKNSGCGERPLGLPENELGVGEYFLTFAVH